METPPTYIPFNSIIWYGPWFILLLIVMLQLIILLLREHMLPTQHNERRCWHLLHEQHDALVQDVYQVLNGTHTALSNVEQRLAIIERIAEQDRATLTDVRDRLTSRSRTTSRKTAREE